ncbi:MAG: glycosyltransferase family 4 protein [Planctomycetes bacterium]|nr:glycosyltransferase family 4 protein [Planctomycetota bacterium]
MPRIAIVFEFGTLNGGERSMLAVTARLRAVGELWQFVALAPPTGPLAKALRESSIEHWPFCVRDEIGRRRPNEQLLPALIEAVQSSRPDLVHANSLAMGRLVGAASPRLSVPTVAHLRDIVRLSRRAVTDLNQNRLLIAVSEATRRFHVSQGLDDRKVSVLYNGVDCDQFQPRPATGWLRHELRLDSQAFLIGTIGQIGLRKGQDVLAEAASRVVTWVPKAHFVLVGARYSQKEESIAFERRLRDIFEQAGLGDRLHPLGYRYDVPQILNELDLLVHPAKQEPLGRVLLEAAASGLPIVATAVGGTPEIFTDDVSALLIPPNDAGALAAAIRQLAQGPEKRRQLGRAARQRAVETFPVSRAADSLAAVWSRLIYSS